MNTPPDSAAKQGGTRSNYYNDNFTMVAAMRQFTSSLSRRATASVRSSASSVPGHCRGLAFYAPTLSERRIGEFGRGGRNSEAGVKVAVFGASGFLGENLCSELGT